MTGPAITVVHLNHAVGGYLHGFRQPFLKAQLRLDLATSVDWDPVDAALWAAIPVDGDAPPVLTGAPLDAAILRLAYWTAALQRHAHQPVLEPGQILRRGAGGAPAVVLALPAIDHAVAIPALHLVVGLINAALSDGPPTDARRQAIQAEISQLRTLGAQQGVSPSMVRFLAAAQNKGMPWRRLSGKIFQIGHGVHTRWLDSSVTDATSTLGSSLVRDKAATAEVLRQAGLPVAAHHLARDEEGAVKAAEALGYPVVVKPMDRDGGMGVFTGLATAAAVRKAFSQARKYSENILVETFIDGRDYRMIVLDGRLVFALQRVPASVVGDGIHTVRQLADLQNALPPPNDGRSVVYKLNLGREAFDLLAVRGMDGDSIPAAGMRLRLSGTADAAKGGRVVAVFDKVHPDNALLTERAVRAMNLDVAGLDLLIPDIARSWKETGAGVCEVNAKPNFGPVATAHIYGQILDSLVKGQGRIPIAVIVGALPGSQAARLASRMIAAAGVKVGVAAPDGVWIDADRITPGATDSFADAHVLIGDRTVEAAVVAVNDARPLVTGLPFDRCDVIALAGSQLAGEPQAGDFDNLVRALSPMARAKVIINMDDPGCMAHATRIKTPGVLLYGAQADSGGADVGIEGATLLLNQGAAGPIRIELNDHADGEDAIACTAEDIVLAAAVARGLGCGEAHLRQGLARVRLSAATA
jgi:cyanophycin synthetase